jgi:hypothetical protein
MALTSDCRMENKVLDGLILGVDLDGVCADFYARMREIAAHSDAKGAGRVPPPQLLKTSRVSVSKRPKMLHQAFVRRVFDRDTE